MAENKLLVKLIGDNGQLTSVIDDTKSRIADLGGDGTVREAGSNGEKVGTALVSKLKGVITAAAIGKVLMDTIKEGANYEQAVGGIETLFGDMADSMIANANRAYKTAGVSATNYMETVTSFSASLLQGLGGDTAKAAKYADQAMIDMSDNANKFGTDIQSIQNAYQGFAKQNYTMLDNLKLGYGGTKEEMERLISDANRVKEANGEMGDLSIESFADVTEAIHIMQTELGITGTTAEEASTTISGSFNAMKASWQNLMAQLVNGGDVGTAMANLGNTVTTFLIGNLLPAIGRIILGIPDMVLSLLSTALPNALTQLSTLLDGLLSEDSSELANNAGNKFGEKILPILANLIPKILEVFAKLIIALPKLAIEAGLGFAKGIVDKIKGGIPNVLDWLENKFASLKLKLPHIKLPHFSISGKLSISPPSIPKLSIDWYKEGGIMMKPTVFGMNGDHLMAGGEAGAEAILPLDRLNEFINPSQPIVIDLAEVLKGVVIENIVKLDKKVVGRETAPIINENFGRRATLSARGV